MRKSRFTEEQIIKVLKEHAAGLSASDVCRKHGISDATFYKWRSRFGGMEISDARKLKALEEENRKLKKLLAETMLDASTLKARAAYRLPGIGFQAVCDTKSGKLYLAVFEPKSLTARPSERSGAELHVYEFKETADFRRKSGGW